MSDRPALVLVHGTRFDSRQWAGYPDLVPQAEVFTVDLPGHGTRAGEDYTSAAAVRVVSEVIDTAVGENVSEAGRPRRRVVLAGHSLGGSVAAGVAEHHPHRVDALVLIGACADPSRHPVLRLVYSGFSRALTTIGPTRMARVTGAVMRRLGASADDLPGLDGYAALPAAWAATMAEAGPSRLSGVVGPVFLVAGQYDQLRIDTRTYARACRDPRVRVIPRATHLAPLTHRTEVAAVLREAVQTVGG